MEFFLGVSLPSLSPSWHQTPLFCFISAWASCSGASASASERWAHSCALPALIGEVNRGSKAGLVEPGPAALLYLQTRA